jgi:hypothetical protein
LTRTPDGLILRGDRNGKSMLREGAMEKVTGRGAPPGPVPTGTTPRDIVTICAECKRVISLRDRNGQPLASPPSDNALVSHGICEACARRLYGPIFNRGR